MHNYLKQRYISPIVLQEVELCIEFDLLTKSVVDQMNKAGVYTTPQEVEHEDFSTGTMNFKWEEDSSL